MKIYICKVKHGNNNKEFIFDCTELRNSIRFKTQVICETMHGDALGEVTMEPIKIEGPENSVAGILRGCGAYLPIKRIKGVQLPLSEDERREVAVEYLREKLGLDGLPY